MNDLSIFGPVFGRGEGFFVDFLENDDVPLLPEVGCFR